MEPLEPRTLLTAVVDTPYTLPVGGSVFQAGDLAFFYNTTVGGSSKGGLFDPYSGEFFPVELSAPIAAGVFAGDPQSITQLGDKTYFAGGNDNLSHGQTFLSSVEIFDESTGVWSTAQLSSARDQVTAVTVGTKVLFVGGLTRETGFSSTADIYDSATGQWTSMTAPISGTTNNIRTAVIGNKAYFFVASDGTNLSSVAVYDADTGVWSQMASPLTMAVQNVSTVGGKFVVLGNTGPNTRMMAEVYDSARNKWTSFTNLGSANFGQSVGVIGSRVVYVGGFTPGGGPDSRGAFTRIVKVYNAANGKWTTAKSAPSIQPNGRQAVQMGNSLDFVHDGGIDIFNASRGSWTTVAAPIHPTGSTQAVDDQIFVYGSYLGISNPAINGGFSVVEDINFTAPGDDVSPTVTFPGAGQSTTIANGTFLWSSTPKAVSYDVLVDGNFIGNATDIFWFSQTPILATGNHTVQIRANLAGGKSLLGPSSDFTIVP